MTDGSNKPTDALTLRKMLALAKQIILLHALDAVIAVAQTEEDCRLVRKQWNDLVEVQVTFWKGHDGEDTR